MIIQWNAGYFPSLSAVFQFISLALTTITISQVSFQRVCLYKHKLVIRVFHDTNPQYTTHIHAQFMFKKQSLRCQRKLLNLAHSNEWCHLPKTLPHHSRISPLGKRIKFIWCSVLFTEHLPCPRSWDNTCEFTSGKGKKNPSELASGYGTLGERFC